MKAKVIDLWNDISWNVTETEPNRYLQRNLKTEHLLSPQQRMREPS